MLTKINAAISGGGIGIGNQWHNVTVPELVRWTAVPIRHGALDGKPGTLFLRWNFNDPRYNSVMDEGISMERYKNIKRYFKLNKNMTTKQWGQEGYDPCAKYDFIYNQARAGRCRQCISKAIYKDVSFIPVYGCYKYLWGE